MEPHTVYIREIYFRDIILYLCNHVQRDRCIDIWATYFRFFIYNRRYGKHWLYIYSNRSIYNLCDVPGSDLQKERCCDSHFLFIWPNLRMAYLRFDEFQIAHVTSWLFSSSAGK